MGDLIFKMKLDIAEKEKTFHLELEKEKAKMLYGKKIGEDVDGSILDPKLNGFKFKITGLTNDAGFPARPDTEGIGLKKKLLTKGIGMSGKRSKKKKKIRGLRLRKTIRGNTIAKDIAQVNLKVLQATKSLSEVLGKVELKEEKEVEKKKEEPKPEPKSEKKEERA